MFGMFRQRPGGLIAYYGLVDWWNSTFTPEEQALIQQKFQPLGGSSSLTTGDVESSSQSVVSFLHSLSGWFNNKRERELAKKMLYKAMALCRSGEFDVVDVHFVYSVAIQTFYPDRDRDPAALEMAISACREQIAIASNVAKALRRKWRGDPLPAHRGYEQLAIILDKQKRYDEAIAICRKAASEKWSGGWEERIERLEKKSQKASRSR